MPRDASGTYTLPIAPFVPLTLAKSAEVNAALSDIADALTDSQSRASPTPAQGDLNMNGNNILNLGAVVGDLTATGEITGGDIISLGGVYAHGQGSTSGQPFGLYFDGGHAYALGWGATGYFDWLNNTTGMKSWRTPVGDVMTLDAAGNLTTVGSVTTGTVTATSVTASGAVTAASVVAGALAANSANVAGFLSVAGGMRLNGLSPYADNASAIAAGHVTGDIYVNTTAGALMVVIGNP
jgi:hypothetical protein